MKKIIVSVLALGFIATVQAQDIPERKGEGFKPHSGPGMHHKKHGGMDFKALNLTEEQKSQMKSQRDAFRKQMDELKKNDNITVKEWKSRMETLRKDQKSKMEGILTADQKAKLETMKTERMAKQKEAGKARMEKMKADLGLTDEQAAKIEKNRKEIGEKMKSIRENKSLSDEAKKEQVKELMKSQKDNMKSVLTEEQMKKLKEHKPHKGERAPGPKKEII